MCSLWGFARCNIVVEKPKARAGCGDVVVERKRQRVRSDCEVKMVDHPGHLSTQFPAWNLYVRCTICSLSGKRWENHQVAIMVAVCLLLSLFVFVVLEDTVSFVALLYRGIMFRSTTGVNQAIAGRYR